MTKRKLVLMVFLTVVFTVLTSASAFATINRTYTIWGNTYEEGVLTGNVNVSLWAFFKREVSDGHYVNYSVHQSCKSNASGQYSITFQLDFRYEPLHAEMWASLPVRITMKPGDPLIEYHTCPYRYIWFNFSAGSQGKNLNLKDKVITINNHEYPEGLPPSWDYVINQFAPGAGSAMNWENRLFGRFPL